MTSLEDIDASEAATLMAASLPSLPPSSSLSSSSSSRDLTGPFLEVLKLSWLVNDAVGE